MKTFLSVSEMFVMPAERGFHDGIERRTIEVGNDTTKTENGNVKENGDAAKLKGNHGRKSRWNET